MLRNTWRKILLLRERVLGTLWFLPSLMTIGAIVLAIAMVEFTSSIEHPTLLRWSRFFGASAGSSRSILASLASGMITVAGLTFSLTMLAVTQASAQYTPRILRNFMSDRTNQFVLGSFVGIFAYCLVVLRTIRTADENGEAFVPSIAVVLGILLSLGGIGVLIYFVHHLAETLQASSIISRITHDTHSAIERLFPNPIGHEAEPHEAEYARIAAEVTSWYPVLAGGTGYVQHVDDAELLDAAAEFGRIIRMDCDIGDFVVRDTPIAWIAADEGPGGLSDKHRASAEVPAPKPKKSDEFQKRARRVASALAIGEYRTVEQDAAFGIRQLVDIAMKALSPGVNDTTTAVNCINYLSAILLQAANRRVESPVRKVDDEVRVLARGQTFETLLRLALDEIRQNAGGNVTVLQELFHLIRRVATATQSPHRRKLLADQIDLVREVAERTVHAPYDLGLLHDAARRAAVAAVAPVEAGPLQ